MAVKSGGAGPGGVGPPRRNVARAAAIREAFQARPKDAAPDEIKSFVENYVHRRVNDPEFVRKAEAEYKVTQARIKAYAEYQRLHPNFRPPAVMPGFAKGSPGDAGAAYQSGCANMGG